MDGWILPRDCSFFFFLWNEKPKSVQYTVLIFFLFHTQASGRFQLSVWVCDAAGVATTNRSSDPFSYWINPSIIFHYTNQCILCIRVQFEWCIWISRRPSQEISYVTKHQVKCLCVCYVAEEKKKLKKKEAKRKEKKYSKEIQSERNQNQIEQIQKKFSVWSRVFGSVFSCW